MRPAYRQPRPARPGRRGFTLIEASLATVIIGVGVVAMLELIAAGTRVNVDGAERTTAMNLAKNIREMSLKVPFAQLRTLDADLYEHVVDSRGEPLAGFEGWKQSVSVRAVDPRRLTHAINDSTPDAVRLSVTVTRHNEPLCTLTWYAFDGTP